MTSTQMRPTRRTLVRGAAWSVPVISIAAAAPAFAASPCDALTGRTLDWDGANVTFSRATDRRSAQAIFDPDLAAGPIPSMSVNLTTGYAGNMIAGTESNGLGTALDRPAAVGGLSVGGLHLVQAIKSDSPDGRGRTDRGAYTFTFTRPVTNLVFTLTDIDSANGDFYDVVEPSPGFTVQAQGSAIGSDFNGPNGTQRFGNTGSSNPLDDTTSGAGNVRLKYAGPINSFTITYWNAMTDFTTDTNQGVFITDMTFDYKPC